LQRLGHVLRRHPLVARKISNGSRHPEHAVVSARTQTQLIDGSSQELPSFCVRTAECRHARAAQGGVGPRTAFAIARVLDAARGDDALTHRRRRFAGDTVDNRADGDRWNIDDEVDAIAKGTREPALIPGDLHRRASARPPIVAGESARAWVHRPDEDEPRREDSGSRRARDRHVSFFERLPKNLEHPSVKLRHFVHEEHTVMGQRDFARPRDGPAADERHGRNRVVRGSKRTLRQKPLAGRQRACD
jgi:hypothetical protein